MEQVLDHFRGQFIRDVDASAIVLELERETIISSSDRTMITSSPNRIQQNKILYNCLRRRCTKEALMAVCEVIIAVQSNPRMKVLGEDMKRMVEGKCCVCSCVCAYICMHDLVCMHTPNYIITIQFHNSSEPDNIALHQEHSSSMPGVPSAVCQTELS